MWNYKFKHIDIREQYDWLVMVILMFNALINQQLIKLMRLRNVFAWATDI